MNSPYAEERAMESRYPPPVIERAFTPPYESDPTGRSPQDPGAKLDAGKPMAGLLADFGLALLAVAEVGTYGARKYTRGGWQSVPDGRARYSDAMWRHLLKERYEAVDVDSGLAHDAQAAWNALARLELRLREQGGAP